MGNEEAVVVWGQHANEYLIMMTRKKSWALEVLEKSWLTAITD